MKINIIGNGSIAAKYMSASAIIDDHILVDMPNGVMKHLKNLEYNIFNIDTILITHLHGDHFFDFPFFMLEKYFHKDNKKVTVIGPKGAEETISKLFEIGFPGDLEKIRKGIDLEFIELSEETSVNVNNIDIESLIVCHRRVNPALGYIVTIDNKSVGFSGDTIYCENVDKIVENTDISVLDMSLTDEGNTAHMGYADIKKICEKYPNKKIIATHMQNITRRKAEKENISNLIVPEINFEVLI